MFTVRQRDPTIRGVFRPVKHPTSPWRHRRRVRDAHVDDIPVVQGRRRQNRGNVLVLCRKAASRRCRGRPRSASSWPAAPSPAGSTVTPVTCAANEAGSVAATSQPGGVPARQQRSPESPAAAGTVSSSRPGGRAGDAPSTRPSPLSVSQVPAGVAHDEARRLLGHDDVHAVGPRHVHRGRAHPRQLLDARRRCAGVDVEQRRMAGQARLCRHLRRRLVHVARSP